MKNNLFIDCDGVLTDSVDAFCKVYSDRYSFLDGFVKPNANQTKKWDFSDTCPLLKPGEVEDIFASLDFFRYLRPFPNAIKVLKELQEQYEITIISIGTFKNISLKTEYIHKTFPFIKNFIGIVNEGVKMDKSIIKGLINPEVNNVFIDDNSENLLSVCDKDLVRFCYGATKTEWNEDWLNMNGRWVHDWLQLRYELLESEDI